MVLRSDAVDLRVFPAGTGYQILALSEAGEEIGSAIVETGPATRFQGGHGYFIDSGVVDEEGAIAVVSSLEVRGAWAGKGIGRAILERAEALAAEDGCESIYVHASNVGRGDPAGFYLACEFEEASPDGSYLRKKITGVNRIADVFGASLGLVNRLLLAPASFWMSQCSTWVEETGKMNRRIFKTFPGA